ncbi:HPP family protein [Paraconexibacter sp. AEG42_29]|uniref:HPP family protein n=1 Tax=Paraconexibacter sp. AEG42_29 TaxID=2997339 RepID=UPI00339D4329
MPASSPERERRRADDALLAPDWPASSARRPAWLPHSGAPPRPPWRVLGGLTLTSVLALVVIVALGDAMHQALLIPPLAASVGLIASVPDQPLAQPRNVIGGHLVSCIVGSVVALVLGHGILVAAIAGGLAVGATLAFRVAHSPAAATAVIVAATPVPFWHFSALLTLATVVLVLLGVADARLRGRTYPVYWW